MSQEKVDKKKQEKRNIKKTKRKKLVKQLLWIFAGCVVIGGVIGFLLGKFWLYPAYRDKEGFFVEAPDYDNQSEYENLQLQDMNRQIEENNEEENNAEENESLENDSSIENDSSEVVE